MGIIHPILDQFTDSFAGKFARDYFEKNGIPNKKNEEFHYTDLSRGLQNIDIANNNSNEANYKSDITIKITNDGFKIIGEHQAIIINENDNIATDGINSLLCSGLSKHNINLKIAENSNTNINIIYSNGARCAISFELGENSILNLIEDGYSNIGLTSINLVAKLDKNSFLRHLLFSNNIGAKHLNASNISIDENANYEFYGLFFGAELARFDKKISLNSKNSKTKINAAYLLDNAQNDFTSTIYHNSPECLSSEKIRGIVNKNGTSIFQGLIKVAKNAQKTIGNMEHRGQMLDEGARIYSKPCLEIYADDVECSHSNTIGALDDKSLFYMQSRGISKAKAKSILTRAFLEEVFDDLLETDFHTEIINKIDIKLEEIIK